MTTELLQILTGIRCGYCANVKRSMQPFCNACYAQLPRKMQRALFEPEPAFAAAYNAAVQKLRETPRGASQTPGNGACRE